MKKTPNRKKSKTRGDDLKAEYHFDYAPFSQRGGLGRAHQLFGEHLPALLDELNSTFAA